MRFLQSGVITTPIIKNTYSTWCGVAELMQSAASSHQVVICMVAQGMNFTWAQR